MVRNYDPAQLTHSEFRDFAVVAAWIATIDEAAPDLEDLLIDVPPEERVLPDYGTPWPGDFDSFVVALTILQETRDASEQGLEELVATWLGEDRENWPVICLTLIDPWQERPSSGGRSAPLVRWWAPKTSYVSCAVSPIRGDSTTMPFRTSGLSRQVRTRRASGK